MGSPHGYVDHYVLEDINTWNFRNDFHSIRCQIHVSDLVMAEDVMAIQPVNQEDLDWIDPWIDPAPQNWYHHFHDNISSVGRMNSW